jgi:hypothetical protein
MKYSWMHPQFPLQVKRIPLFEECSICLRDNTSTIVMLECGHRFCKDCMVHELMQNKCAFCRFAYYPYVIIHLQDHELWVKKSQNLQSKVIKTLDKLFGRVSSITGFSWYLQKLNKNEFCLCDDTMLFINGQSKNDFLLLQGKDIIQTILDTIYQIPLRDLYTFFFQRWDIDHVMVIWIVKILQKEIHCRIKNGYLLSKSCIVE